MPLHAAAGMPLAVCACLTRARARSACSLRRRYRLNPHRRAGLGTDTNRERRFVALVNKKCRGTEFSLAKAGIGSRGAGVIANLLTGACKQVTTLDLCDNPTHDAGAAALAKSLASSSCALTHLDMRGNGVSHVGGQLLMLSLRENRSA